ncbi:MAG: DUF2125 domain-containing protein, partial [Chloroflexi bacterium]|nr:DUF2125 domain-containing protein [Chloroflexota bacterium]
DNGDGTWDYAQTQRDWDLVYSLPGAVDVVMRYAEMAGSGVFDETLMAFTTYTGTMRDMTMTQVIAVMDEPEQRSTYTVGASSWESTSTPSASGGVDGTLTYTTTDTVQTMQVPGIEDPSQMTDVTITIPRNTLQGTSTGIDMPAIYRLHAWFVARPSGEAITRDQADLKALLIDGLPFFEMIEGTSTVEGARVASPLGEFAVASAGVEFAMSGLVTDGLFREVISMTGLTMPAGIVPDWAAGLVPSDSSNGFEITGFDLAATAATLLPALDFTNPDLIDPAVMASVLPQLLPTGAVTVTMTPGGTTAPLYALTYEGTMQAGPDAMPTGRATVTMTGMDAVIDALNASGLTVEDGIGPGLAMARGVARPGEGGALVWEIDATVPGTLKINGTDYAPMMGGME